MTAVAAPASVARQALPAEWRQEHRWVIGFAVLVMLVTTLPYLAGFASQGQDWRFSGFVFGVEDGNSYIAKMLSGSSGAWLFRTPYTSLPQTGVLAFLPYLLLGKLISTPGAHEQAVALFQLFRIGAGFLEILATYQFLSLFLNSRAARRLGLALCSLGGGLGWMFVLAGNSHLLGSLPLEFYSPETFGFLAIFGLPHLALARAALLWALRLYLEPGRAPGGSLRLTNRLLTFDPAGAKAGALLWVLGLAQPLTVVIAWVVIGVDLAARGLQNWTTKSDWQSWLASLRRAAWAMAISSPLVIYTAFAFRFDPYLQQWAVQNRILSPHPLNYLLAYGLVLPFAVDGATRVLRQQADIAWLPVAWALILPALAYLPYNLQRRLTEGGWVALVVLACAALDGWLQRQPARGKQRPLAFYPLALAFPSALMLVSGGILAVVRPAMPLFRPAAEISTFEVLAAHAQPGAVVVSAYETGNALPAWAPMRVVIGHGPESAKLEQFQKEVTNFYTANTSDAWRVDFLHQVGASFVFWGPAERNLGEWDPGQARYLTFLEKNGDYAVYAWNAASK